MFNTAIFSLNDPQLMHSLRMKYVESGMRFGGKSNPGKPYDYGHWSKQILTASRYRLIDQVDMPMIKQLPEIEYIWNAINQQMGGNRGLMRTYVNGYTYGTDAYAHIDDAWIPEKFGNDCTTETAVLYLNDSWLHDWCGETVVYTNDFEIETSVLPKEGRVLVFDSRKFHGARPVSRSCPVLRSVMVFKTFDKRYEDKALKFAIETLKDRPDVFDRAFDAMCMLETMNASEDICIAGFYAVAYDLTDMPRAGVSEVIGDRLENLANTYKECGPDSSDKDMLAIEFAKLYVTNEDGQHNQLLSELHNKLQLA